MPSLQILSHPEVSIIVSVYNIEKYLKKCVDSILSQAFSDFECILVDDCSPDNSPTLCDEYARKDERIKVIHNKKNQGSSQARKTGLERATGDYVLYIDGDDWVEADILEKMYDKAANGGFDIVLCDYLQEFPNEAIYEKQDINNMDKFAIIKDLVVMKHLACCVWNKLVKREIYLKVIFPKASYSEDRVITLQTIYYAEKITHINKALYHYRHNTNSISKSEQAEAKRSADQFANYLLIIAFLEDKYGKPLSMFEPELSDRINSVKLPFAINKKIRDTTKLHELYPESNKYIFNKTWDCNILNKIAMVFALKNIPFPYFVIEILQTIYRIIIPKKIRKKVWERKNTAKHS